MYFRASRRDNFSFFLKIIGVLTSDTFWNFCGSCYNTQFKPYVTSKMEVFVKIKVMDVNCFYIELRLRCDRPLTSDSHIYR